MTRPGPATFALIMLLVGGSADATSLDHAWSQAFGDAGIQEAVAVALDGSDNILLAGEFRDEIQLGAGTIVSASFPDTDHFLAKLDPAGEFVWGVPLNDGQERRTPVEIMTDSQGNVVAFGSVAGGQASNPRDVWLAMYDGADGALMWSQRFGDGEIQSCWGATVDASDNLYLTGPFSGTVDFGGVPLSTSGVGDTDFYAVRFDAQGKHEWSARYGDTSGQYGNGIRVDADGNIFLAGEFAGTIDFGGALLTSTGANEIYLAKLDAGGNHVWSKKLAGSTAESFDDMITDAAGNVTVAGSFWGTLDFGGGPRVSNQYDAFVVTYDATGQYVSDLTVGGAGSTQGIQKIAFDANGVLTVLGWHQGGIELGGATIPTAGFTDFWLGRFNPDGEHLWSTSYGGADWDIARGFAIDSSGNAIIGGYFFGYHPNVTLNVGGDDFVNAVGEADIFLATYAANATAVPQSTSSDPGIRLSFPNPTRRGTTIHYSIPAPSQVRLSILDVSGRVVATLHEGEVAARAASVSWDGRDRTGAAAVAGVYFVRVDTEAGSAVRKLVLLD